MTFVLALAFFAASSLASADTSLLNPSRTTTSRSSLLSGHTACSPRISASSYLAIDDSLTTVNALNATLKWWNKSLVTEKALTLSLQYNTNDVSTGWTILPAVTNLDVSTAIAKQKCSPYITTYPEETFTWSACTPVVISEAASTSGVTIKAYKEPTTSTGTGTIPDLRITPPPAVATIGRTTFSSAIPFVYFSRYELVSNKCNGTYCSKASQTYQLSSPYAFSYSQAITKQISTVSGQLDSAFPQYLNRSSLVAGSFNATPVIIVVVEEVAVAVAVLAATPSPLPTQASLDTPTAVLPTYFSQLPRNTDQNVPKTTQTGGPRIQVTQSWLLVPPPPPVTLQPERETIDVEKTTTTKTHQITQGLPPITSHPTQQTDEHSSIPGQTQHNTPQTEKHGSAALSQTHLSGVVSSGESSVHLAPGQSSVVSSQGQSSLASSPSQSSATSSPGQSSNAHVLKIPYAVLPALIVYLVARELL